MSLMIIFTEMRKAKLNKIVAMVVEALNRQPQEIKSLEKEWAKLKYLILAYSPKYYQAIRQLLKDKSAYPKDEFIHLIQLALGQEEKSGYQRNALEHIWGHFKKQATQEEYQSFQELLSRQNFNETLDFPLILADQYQETFIQNAYLSSYMKYQEHK